MRFPALVLPLVLAGCGYPRPDDVPGDALICFGTGFFVPCFATPPTGIKRLSGSINTDNSPKCEAVAIPACVISGARIEIEPDALLETTGSRPLVLVASDEVSISGTLDVASKQGVMDSGPGGNPPSCEMTMMPLDGGGGAGGSFGTRGGAGGDAAPAGKGGLAAMMGAFRIGGCRGQNGSRLTGLGVPGGNGGGVAYVIAGASISITSGGSINASGAGGDGGQGSTAGGGGGGSGGLIWLEAPQVLQQGLLLALGGGGGGGAQSTTFPTGSPGADAQGPTAPAGGAGSGAAGAGGAGEAGGPTSSGTLGKPGSNGGGGGGGGGGAGVIRVVPVQALAGDGQSLPAPS